MNHCGTQVIKTKRLVLRPFVLADAADLLELWIADPAVQGEYGEPTYETWMQWKHCCANGLRVMKAPPFIAGP